MRSPVHCKRIIESRRALMASLVVIMFCNLLPLSGSIAAIRKKECAIAFPHLPITVERNRNSVTPDSLAGFTASSAPGQITASPASIAHNKLPMMFEANFGQTDSQVKFLARGDNYEIFLTSTEAVILLNRHQLNNRHARSKIHQRVNSDTDKTHAVLRLKLVGGATEPQALGLEELRGKRNYLMGSDPQKWHTDVPLYAKVQYKSIYPGIDIVYYGNNRELEYDFVVAAGADPAQIKLSFDGAQKIRTAANGDLVIKTTGGEVRQHKPLIYQEVEGVKKEIKGRYVLKGRNEVGFTLADYDREKPLIIDPVISYASYIGGSEEDQARAIAVDSNGCIYVTGRTFSAGPLPDNPSQAHMVAFPTKSAFQPALSRQIPEPVLARKGEDVFVAKFDPSKEGADSLVYSTFLGGSGPEEGLGIAVDSEGNAYVTGQTRSVDSYTTPLQEVEFPVFHAFQPRLNSGGVDNGCESEDAFLTKLNASGNGLLYSTYFGGSGVDKGNAISVDSFGNAYVAGQTLGECRHRSCDNFPLECYLFPLRNHLEPYYPGDSNGFIAKFNTSASGNASLVFSTMLGGGPNGGDSCNAIAVTSSGDRIYVAGSTISPNFPVMNAYQPQIGNRANAFVTVINDTGSLSILYSTFLGGANAGSGSSANAIAIDSSGNAYVTGFGADPFPTKNPLPGTFARGPFIAKINPFESGADSLVYSTCLTVGTGGPEGYGIAVDAEGYAYVTGKADTATSIRIKNPMQPYGGGNSDAFIAKLNPTGNDLVYSSYLGGNDEDQGLGIALDVAGNVYVAGFTESLNFPVTPNAFATTKASSTTAQDERDVFVAKIIDKQTDLAITTTASADPVVTGSNLTYTITVTNLGSESAHPIIVTANLPREVSFISSIPPTTGTHDRRTIRFESLAVGASVSFTIEGEVSCFTSDGTIMTGTATVTSLTPDSDISNNSTALQTVASNPPPVMRCPSDIITMSPIVNYPEPIVGDNCLGLMMTRCSPPSGSRFPIGVTMVSCTISDAGGNDAKCSFTVTVKEGPRLPVTRTR